MFRRLVFSASLLLSAAAPGWVRAQEPAPAGRPMLAVMPLKGEGRGQFGDQSDAIYQKVTASFFKTKRFELMERSQLAAVLGEAKFQNSGMADESTAVALGKQLGVKFVVVGSFSGDMSHSVNKGYDSNNRYYEHHSYPAKVSVNLRMVSVETGRIQETMEATGASREASPTSAIAQMMNDLTRKLDREVSNKFPLSGFVIQVINEKEALIDLGRAAGVQKGDYFLVVQRGQDIVHPVTGKVIPGKKTVLTELKVTAVDDETSTVKIAGERIPLKVGTLIESKPKERGFWEALGDFGK